MENRQNTQERSVDVFETFLLIFTGQRLINKVKWSFNFTSTQSSSFS